MTEPPVTLRTKIAAWAFVFAAVVIVLAAIALGCWAFIEGIVLVFTP